MAIASFPVCAALMMYGPWWALGVFAVTAALGNILFPGLPGLAYALVLGYYPLLKSLFERKFRPVYSLLLKLAVYSAAFAAYWALAERALAADELGWPWPLLYALGAATFVIYDWAYSFLIRVYIEKIARYFP